MTDNPNDPVDTGNPDGIQSDDSTLGLKREDIDPSLHTMYDNIVKTYQRKSSELHNEHQGDVTDWRKERDDYKESISKLEQANLQWDSWYKTNYDESGARTNNDPDQSNLGNEDPVTVEQFKEAIQLLRNEYVTDITQRDQETKKLLLLYKNLSDVEKAHGSDEGYDVNKVLSTAKEKGMANLGDAYTLSNLDSIKEAYAKSEVDKAKEKWQQEQTNNNLNVMDPRAGASGSMSYSTPDKPLSKSEAKQKTLNDLAKQWGVTNLP